MALEKYRTKIELLGHPVGTKVTYNNDPSKDNIGKTGKLLCTVLGGGALFFSKEELESDD